MNMKNLGPQDTETEHRYAGENPVRTLIYLFREQKPRVILAFIFFCIKYSPVWVLPLLTANIIDVINKHGSFTKITVDLVIMVLILVQNWPMNLLYVIFQSTLKILSRWCVTFPMVVQQR